MAEVRITQQRCGFIQPPFQHVMGEALSGLFEEQVHVARRNAEKKRDRDCAQIPIATATLNLVQNGRTPRRADAAFLSDRSPFTLSAKRERDKIDNVFAVKFGRPAGVQTDIENDPEITEQQALCRNIFVEFFSRKASDVREQ